LLNSFLEALNCGAISEKDILLTGLAIEETETRSFYRILAGRRRPAYRLFTYFLDMPAR
jgi:signal transduction histidine kinase